MSLVKPNVDIFPAGMEADSLVRTAFLQNVVRVAGAWEVRGGFGQLCQFDTGLAYGTGTAPTGGSSLEGGAAPTIRAHLGSRAVKTTFGHEQIVSAFSADVFTGNVWHGTSTVLRPVGQYVRAVLVAIYDVTTRELWEEVLFPTTSGYGMDTNRRHGVRETSQMDTFDDLAAQTDNPLWWSVLGDIVFFGSADVGTWYYVPGSFRGRRPGHLLGETWRNAHFRGESESSLIREVVPGDGIYADAYTYLNTALFPKPSAACFLGNRAVYADGRTIWFSDANAPASVMADNFVQLWGPEEIAAVLPINDFILVWTEHTTWIYEPAGADGRISAGRLSLLSDSCGAYGPNTVAQTPGGVVWFDSTGVYLSVNGRDIKPISAGVDAFWRGDGIANPMSSYYHAAGQAFLDVEQPPVRWAWDDQDLRMNLIYDGASGLTVATFPTQRISLVWDGEGWVLWNHESCPGTYHAPIFRPETYQRIQAPWLVTGETIYIVGGPEALLVTDLTRIGGTTYDNRHVNLSSWYLLEWGRGGGIDRSIEHVSEDRRVVHGRYYDLSASLLAPPKSGGRSCVYIDPWLALPVGYRLPAGALAVANTYLWPISLVCESTFTGGPASFDIRFLFDNVNWRPAFQFSFTDIDAIHPSERLASVAGYGVGLGEIACYQAGAPNQLGNEIRIRWTVPPGHAFGSMNMALEQRCMLLYLPMVHITAANTTTAGIAPSVATIVDEGPTTHHVAFVAWQQEHFASRYSANERAQPVDWVIKGRQLSGAGEEVKSCGLALTVKSHGRGTPLVTAYLGLLNAACGSNFKDWVSQIVDYSPTAATGAAGVVLGEAALQQILDVGTLRTRFWDAAAVPAQMRERRFGTGPTWGDVNVAASGNYLVDVEEFNTVQIADRCRGEEVNWMVFGCILNRAEALTIGTILADLVAVSGTKRKGR